MLSFEEQRAIGQARQRKTVVGFGDPSVLRRSDSRVHKRGFPMSRAQWEGATPAGSVRPVRQPVAVPGHPFGDGPRGQSTLRRVA